MKKLIFAFVLLISSVSCRKDAIILTNENFEHVVKNIAIIKSNNIYFLSHLQGNAEQITHTSMVDKSNLKMSYDYQKFAYLNSEGVIEIVNRSGLLVAILSNFTDVKSFDWSVDSQTLWVLNNNSIEYYGPEMDILEITYPPTIPEFATVRIELFSISKNGDLAYCYNWSDYDYDFQTGQESQCYGNGVVRIYNDDDQTLKFTDGEGTNYSRKYLQFSTNEQDLVVGTGKLNGLYSFEYYRGYDHFSVGVRTGSFSTPIYRSDLNILLYPKTTEDVVPLSKIHVEDTKSGTIVEIDELIAYNTILYMDWK